MTITSISRMYSLMPVRSTVLSAFMNTTENPPVERLLIPDMALTAAEYFAVNNNEKRIGTAYGYDSLMRMHWRLYPTVWTRFRLKTLCRVLFIRIWRRFTKGGAIPQRWFYHDYCCDYFIRW